MFSIHSQLRRMNLLRRHSTARSLGSSPSCFHRQLRRPLILRGDYHHPRLFTSSPEILTIIGNNSNTSNSTRHLSYLTSSLFHVQSPKPSGLRLEPFKDRCENSGATTNNNATFQQPTVSFFSSSTNATRPKTRGKRTRSNSAFERNKTIISLGKQGKWQDILKLYYTESEEFSNVNYATSMSQFKRIRTMDRTNRYFLKFIDDLARKIEVRGLDWIGVREIANIAHAIGKMRLRNSSTRNIMDAASGVIKQGNPQEVANTAWAFATLGSQSPALFSEIDRRATWLVEHGNPQHVANTAWACATLGLQSPALFSEIDRRASSLVNEGNPQNVANVAWAFATLGIQSEALFSEIDRRATWLVDQGNPQNIANTAWACATLGIRLSALFSKVDGRASWLVEQGKPQEVANTAWAFATLGILSPGLFSEIDNRASWLVDRGNPQTVANMAWACATLGIRSPVLFSEIDRRATWLVQHGTPQAVANTAWACATLGIRSSVLFSEIDRRAEWLGDHGNPQTVANIAWAIATLDIQSPELFSEIDRRAKWLVDQGNPQEVSNTAWAFGKMGIHSPALFSEIDRRATWLVDQGKPQAVANTAWACATLGIHSPELFFEIDRRVTWLVDQGKPQAVANTAWAFATLGVQSPNLFDRLSLQLGKILEEPNEQILSNLCYAFAVQDLAQIYPREFGLLWSKLLNTDPKKLSVEASTQVAQAYAFVKANGMDLVEPSSDLRNVIHTDQHMSRSQIEVSKLLHELGFEHDLEVPPFRDGEFSFLPSGMLAIDMACRDRMVAIEFDGPFHFLIDIKSGRVSKEEDGATKAKRRFLERLGWQVVNIHYLEWIDATEKGTEEQFLRMKLNEYLDDNHAT